MQVSSQSGQHWHGYLEQRGEDRGGEIGVNASRDSTERSEKLARVFTNDYTIDWCE
jgi:hypothetical protein